MNKGIDNNVKQPMSALMVLEIVMGTFTFWAEMRHLFCYNTQFMLTKIHSAYPHNTSLPCVGGKGAGGECLQTITPPALSFFMLQKNLQKQTRYFSESGQKIK